METDSPAETDVIDGDPIEIPAAATPEKVTEDSTSLVVAGAMPLIATMDDQEFALRLQHGKQLRSRLVLIHKEIMVNGVDYGLIPGTKNPTLLKPGAEILFQMNVCTPVFKRQCSYGDGENQPHILWDVVCFAKNTAGQIVAEGSGSCNSFETKYRYRNADRKCPECGEPRIRQSDYKEEFYCWKKKGGCDSKFAIDDERITSQPKDGKVINPDPWEGHNTYKKIADKRAMVACALNLGAASGSFTQDIEELMADDKPKEDAGEAQRSKSGESKSGLSGKKSGASKSSGSKVPSGPQLKLALAKCQAASKDTKFAPIGVLRACLVSLDCEPDPDSNFDELVSKWITTNDAFDALLAKAGGFQPPEDDVGF